MVTRLRLKDPALLDDFFTDALAAIEQAQKSDGNLGVDALADANNAWWSVTSWQERRLMQSYVRTALAKGMTHRRMLRRHAVPAAVAPVFTLAGVTVPVMVTNMVLVELTFSVPGVFQTVRLSMEKADFPVIQGTVIAAAFLVAFASLVVDVALAWLDPKVRAGTA